MRQSLFKAFFAWLFFALLRSGVPARACGVHDVATNGETMLRATMLQVDKASLDTLVAWYQKCFGMTVAAASESDSALERRLVFPNQAKSSGLLLSAPKRNSKLGPYRSSGSDVYWKIGVGAPDVVGLHKWLGKHKVTATHPHQFGDIGFMSHTRDHLGFTIELLQHEFEKNFSWKESEEQKAGKIGQPLHVGQITLRTADYKKSVAFYESIGMKLLSIQDVRMGGFCLYFLAFTDETPPNDKDLKAVENREWLWARPYTTLELQYYLARGDDTEFAMPDLDSEEGFMGMEIQLSGQEHADSVRKNPGLGSVQGAAGEKSFTGIGPDGVPLKFVWE